jgi:hypothetical protein
MTITFDSPTVATKSGVTGTVTLDSPAPAGGLTFQLGGTNLTPGVSCANSSNDPTCSLSMLGVSGTPSWNPGSTYWLWAYVPMSVTIPAGQTTATFSLNVGTTYAGSYAGMGIAQQPVGATAQWCVWALPGSPSFAQLTTQQPAYGCTSTSF